MTRFDLTQIQAQAILDMRLQRLVGGFVAVLVLLIWTEVRRSVQGLQELSPAQAAARAVTASPRHLQSMLLLAEISARLESQLVYTGLQRVTLEDGTIKAAVGIGAPARQFASLARQFFNALI